LRSLREGRATRETQAQHAGAFIEGFASGIIEGLPKKIHTAFGHGVDGGMAAGGYERDEGRREVLIGEVGSGDVAYEVVYGN
jgi:hypothetical protein